MVVYEQNGMFWREPGDTTGLGAASLGVNDEVSAGLPVNHLVVSAYPNPFNPETTVNATLPKKADLEVAVYDILGRQIYVIDRGTVTAGTHTLTLDASNWSAGVYFVRVKANELQEVVKIQLVK